MREIVFFCFLAAKLLLFHFINKRFLLNTQGRIPKGDRHIPNQDIAHYTSFVQRTAFFLLTILNSNSRIKEIQNIISNFAANLE